MSVDLLQEDHILWWMNKSLMLLIACRALRVLLREAGGLRRHHIAGDMRMMSGRSSQGQQEALLLHGDEAASHWK